MRMNQTERKFDFHGLGLALKKAREEKGWTQAYVAELVDRDSRTILIGQFYFITLLYFQSELFKKSAIEKEMNELNLLYERQRQQYQVARQNVQIINKRCHELKVQIANLRKLSPEAVPQERIDEAERAARLYDANRNTGNEVLDVVLTEKSLLCESRGIQLNAVANGSCLGFFEAGDLYALFANALDHAVESAVQVSRPECRVIDLLVCVRQGFVVVNIISPLGFSEYGAEGMPNLHSAHPRRGDHTEEYQAKYHEYMLKCFDRHPWLWATHVWNMFDFAADARDQGGEPGMNHKGLVTFDRQTKKDSFYLYKAWWSEENFVHICSKRFTDRTEKEIEVKVYSNQNSVALYADGKKLAEQTGEHIFKFRVPLHGKVELKAVAGDCIDTASFCSVAEPNPGYKLVKTKSKSANWV